MTLGVDTLQAMNRPSREAAAPLLASLLAVLALPATGLASAPWLPSAPATYAALALVVCALTFLGVGTHRRGPRAVLLLLAAGPALWFGLRGGGALQPSVGWWGLLLVCALLPWLPRGHRAALALLTGGLAGWVLLGSADASRLAALGDPFRAPLAAGAAHADRTQHPDATQRGLRAGAAVAPADGVNPALGEGPGPWFVEAASAQHPGPRPVIAVLSRGTLGPALLAAPQGTLVPSADLAPGALTESAAIAWRGVDVVVVMENAWGPEDAQARAKAQALAAFVRAGGLLMGPAPGRPWPARLVGMLRAAGRSPVAGADGARRLGMGWVTRAAHQRDVAGILEADLWVQPVGTSLLDPTAQPAPLASWTPWADAPSERRRQGGILLLHALALLMFTRLLRGGGAQVLGTFLVAAVAWAGLVWTAPQDPGFRAEGVVVDLGGAGGRRLEAVWISAGPGGYTGHVRFRGGGVVGLRGGRLLADGRLRIEAGRSAWVIRETAGRGVVPGDKEDRSQSAALGLLRGTPDLKRIRLGRLPALPVRVEGWGALPAATVLVRPPES